MAKIKYGDIVTEIRGARGGAVYSKNKYGYYVKPNAVPINKQTPAQQETRTQFLQYTKSYQSLTDIQRNEWDYFASINPVTDSLGNTIYLTGANWFLKLNLNRTLNTDITTVIENAPANSIVETCLFDFVNAALAYGGANDLQLGNFTLDGNMVTSPNHYIVVDITPPLRPGQNISDNLYRYWGSVTIGTTTPNLTTTNPTNLKENDVVSLRIRFYNSANGIFSTQQTGKTTVVVM